MTEIEKDHMAEFVCDQWHDRMMRTYSLLLCARATAKAAPELSAEYQFLADISKLQGGFQ